MWVTQVLQNQAANRDLLLILTPREEAAGSTLGGPCTVAFSVLFGDIAKYHSYLFRNGVRCGKLECVPLNRELLLSATASCAYEEILARSY